MKREKICRAAKWFFMLPGVLIVANAITATLLSNIHVGILLTFFLGFACLLCGFFFRYIMRFVPKWLLCLFAAGILLVVVFVLFLFLYGSADSDAYTEDAVIVLGAGIRGEELSDNLKNRLDCAIAYHAKNPAAVIVVSGGQGPQEDITEALAMERYLLANGIPKQQIIKEEKATSTAENFRFSKALLEQKFNAPYSFAFITSDYHVYRAKNIARLTGFYTINHYHNTTPWYMILPNGLRECLAVMKLWVLGT